MVFVFEALKVESEKAVLRTRRKYPTLAVLDVGTGPGWLVLDVGTGPGWLVLAEASPVSRISEVIPVTRTPEATGIQNPKPQRSHGPPKSWWRQTHYCI